LNCGLGSKIGDLISAGVSKDGKAACQGLLQDPKNFKSGFSDSCYYKNAKENTLFYQEKISVARANIKSKLRQMNKIKAGETPTTPEWKCLEGFKADDKVDFQTLFNCHCRGKVRCEIPGITDSQQANKYTYGSSTKLGTNSNPKINA